MLCRLMNPALNRSTALQRFKRGNVVKIHNGLMFDLYPGLPHIWQSRVEIDTWFVEVWISNKFTKCI